MKKFFKIDLLVQMFVFSIVIICLLYFWIFEKFGEHRFYFYMIVGGFQLISFTIRLFLKYKKSIIFKIYGYLIGSVWLIIFLSIILKDVDFNHFEFLNNIAKGFYLLSIISIFYSPILSILYIFDIRRDYKRYSEISQNSII